jgi:hypothetical protein
MGNGIGYDNGHAGKRQGVYSRRMLRGSHWILAHTGGVTIAGLLCRITDPISMDGASIP